MNVLVYPPLSTTEPTAQSYTTTHPILPVLRKILTPFYTTQTITSSSLATHPWPTSCALLVIAPPSTGLSIAPEASLSVQNYVSSGGRVLCLGLGLSVSNPEGKDALRFWDESIKSYVYISAASAGTQESTTSDGLQFTHTMDPIHGIPGANVAFLDPLPASCSALAYRKLGDAPAVAGVELSVGDSQGRIALYDIAPTTEPSSISHELLLSRALSALGLTLPSSPSNPTSSITSGDKGLQPPMPTHPLPQILLSTPSNPGIIERILTSLGATSLPCKLADAADTFSLEAFHSSILADARIMAPGSNSGNTPEGGLTTHSERRILVPQKEDREMKESMPMFDAELFYQTLQATRKGDGLPEYDEHSGLWGMGEAMFYGEAVTSTQTMLDK